MIPAVVLSCDKYHAFARHSILAYHRVWPSVPFEFIVPYQESTREFPDPDTLNVRFKRTGPSIKETVLGLLEGFADDDWIYWCMDDKFPVGCDEAMCDRICSMIDLSVVSDIGGLLFCRPEKLYMTETLTSKEMGLVYPGSSNCLRVLERTDYSMIWLHQLVRVKVIRWLFESFPGGPFPAKQMDLLKYRVDIPSEWPLFVTDRSYMYFGESTTRGRVTKNCAESMQRSGLEIPNGWLVDAKRKEIGRRSFLGDLRGIRMACLRKRLSKLCRVVFPVDWFWERRALR